MARLSIWQKKFDPDLPHVVRRPFKLNGIVMKAGQPFDRTLVSTRTMRQLYEARKIEPVGEAVQSMPVQAPARVKHVGFGKFTVMKGEEWLMEPASRDEAERFLAAL